MTALATFYGFIIFDDPQIGLMGCNTVRLHIEMARMANPITARHFLF